MFKVKVTAKFQNVHEWLSRYFLNHWTFYYQTWYDDPSPRSQKVKWFRKYWLEKHSLTFWVFAVTLTLNTAIQFLRKTLWLMIMYYQTTFGSKSISSSKHTVEIVTFWSYELLQGLRPWKWQINLFERQSGSNWCITIPGLLVKGSAIKKI